MNVNKWCFSVLMALLATASASALAAVMAPLPLVPLTQVATPIPATPRLGDAAAAKALDYLRNSGYSGLVQNPTSMPAPVGSGSVPVPSAGSSSPATTSTDASTTLAKASPKAPDPTFHPGQSLYIRDDLEGLTPKDDPKDSNWCSGPRAMFVVTADENHNGTNVVSFSVDNPGKKPLVDEPVDASNDCKHAVIEGHVYLAVEDSLKTVDYSSEEMVVGLLAVPFKFHLGDHSTTAGGTIGGYIGERWATPAFAVTPIASFGLALVDSTPAQVSSSASSSMTSSSSGASSSSKTLTGVTAAFGVVTTLGSSKTQAGVLVGWDYVGHSEQYKYEAKPWLSAEIGYNFLGSAK